MPSLDRTAKLFIGGRQVRPDQGYSLPVRAPDGRLVGTVAHGNRKDIRNAVEAAHKARAWAHVPAHQRAQVLYYLAENLAPRSDELTARLLALGAPDAAYARAEVALSIERLFDAAASADKYDGAVHATPYRNVTLAMPEPLGVLGIVCTDDAPLLGFVSVLAPAIAMGNAVIVVPSERAPLLATDFYQVVETSDVPAGVVNVVTGPRAELAPVLAGHDDVDGLWYFPADGGAREVERLAAGNMKRTWCAYTSERDWRSAPQGSGEAFLRHATQVKNIWVPYGE